MSKVVHPLFLTRGVPGTHDLNLINQTFAWVLQSAFHLNQNPKAICVLKEHARDVPYARIDPSRRGVMKKLFSYYPTLPGTQISRKNVT